MRKERAVTVAKVKAPDLDVLVGRPAHEQVGIRGDVHSQHRQLVTVQAQEELEAVQEENFDGAVQQSGCQKLACIADARAQSGIRVDSQLSRVCI